MTKPTRKIVYVSLVIVVCLALVIAYGAFCRPRSAFARRILAEGPDYVDRDKYRTGSLTDVTSGVQPLQSGSTIRLPEAKISLQLPQESDSPRIGHIMDDATWLFPFRPTRMSRRRTLRFALALPPYLSVRRSIQPSTGWRPSRMNPITPSLLATSTRYAG